MKVLRGKAKARQIEEQKSEFSILRKSVGEKSRFASSDRPSLNLSYLLYILQVLFEFGAKGLKDPADAGIFFCNIVDKRPSLMAQIYFLPNRR